MTKVIQNGLLFLIVIALGNIAKAINGIDYTLEDLSGKSEIFVAVILLTALGEIWKTNK